MDRGFYPALISRIASSLVGSAPNDERPAGAMKARRARRRKIFRRNTIDLQWKMRANYNARLCAGFRKSAGARTMGNNGKNNAHSNRNSRKIRASADVRLDAGRQGDGVARESPLSGMRRFDILVMPG